MSCCDHHHHQQQQQKGENVGPRLNIDMHCSCNGCVNKIVNCLRNMNGVLSVKVEEEDSNTKISMTVGNVDPCKLQKELQKKIKKKVEIVPAKSDGNNYWKGKQSDHFMNKPNQVVVKVNMDRDKTVQKIHKVLAKTRGIEGISIDRAKQTVTLTGNVDRKCLVYELEKKLQRCVEVVVPEKKKITLEATCYCCAACGNVYPCCYSALPPPPGQCRRVCYGPQCHWDYYVVYDEPQNSCSIM